MGVKGLWKLLMPIGRRISIETLEGKVLAVDASIWLTQFITAMRDPDSGSVRPAAHIIGFFRRLCRLRFHGIRPVFVFDGATPEIKRREIQLRRKRREQFSTQHGKSMIQRMAKQILVQQLKKQKLGHVSSSKENAAFAPGFRPLEIVDQNENKDDEETENARGNEKLPKDQNNEGKAKEQEEPSEQKVHVPGMEAAQPINIDSDDEDGIISPHSDPANVVDLENDWDKPILNDEESLQSKSETSNDDQDQTSDDSEYEDDGDFIHDYYSKNVDDDFNTDHIYSLPPGERKDAIEDAKRMQRMRSRKEFMPVAAKPSDYSQVQLRNFLRSSRLNRSIVKMATKAAHNDNKGQLGEVTASDRTRRVLYEKNVVKSKKHSWSAPSSTIKSRKRRRNMTANSKQIKQKCSTKRRELANSSSSDSDGSKGGHINKSLGLKEEDWTRNGSQVRDISRIASDSEDGGGFICGDLGSKPQVCAAETTLVKESYISDDSESVGFMLHQSLTDKKQSELQGDNDAETIHASAAQELEDSILARAIQDSVDDAACHLTVSGTDILGTSAWQGVETNTGKQQKAFSARDWGNNNYNEWEQPAVGGEKKNAAALEQAEATASNLTNWAGRAVRRAIAQHREDTGAQAITQKGPTNNQFGFVDSTLHDNTPENIVERDQKKGFFSNDKDFILHVASAQERAEKNLAYSKVGGPEEAHETGRKNKLNACEKKSNALNENSNDEEDEDIDWESGDEISNEEDAGITIHANPSPTQKVAGNDFVGDPANKVSQSKAAKSHKSKLQERTKKAEETFEDNSGDEEEKIGWESGDEVGDDRGNMIPTKSTTFKRAAKAKEKEEIYIDVVNSCKKMASICTTYNCHPSSVQFEKHKTDSEGKSNNSIVENELGKNGDIDSEHNSVKFGLSNELQMHGSIATSTKDNTTGEGSKDEEVDWEDCNDTDNEGYVGKETDDVCTRQSLNTGEQNEKDGDNATAAGKQAEAIASNLTNWAGGSVLRAIPEKIENYDFAKESMTDDEKQEEQNPTTSPFFKDAAVRAKQKHEIRNHCYNDEIMPISNPNMDETLVTTLEESFRLEKDGKQLEREIDTVTDEMRLEAMQLLQLFGVPYVEAPAEAEAQCVTLEKLGLVNGIVTEDSDAFVFGGKIVYKNIFDDQKYVEVYRADDAKRELGLGSNQMVALAMLLGGDYTAGIKGVGIVNGMEILETFDVSQDLRMGLTRFRAWLDGFDPADAVLSREMKNSSSSSGLSREKVFHLKHKSARTRWNAPENFPADNVMLAYTNPVVDTSRDDFSWGIPDLGRIVAFCNHHIGWRSDETQAMLEPVIKKVEGGSRQTRIDSFMTYEHGIKFASVRSKRLRDVFTSAQSEAGRAKEKER